MSLDITGGGLQWTAGIDLAQLQADAQRASTTIAGITNNAVQQSVQQLRQQSTEIESFSKNNSFVFM